MRTHKLATVDGIVYRSVGSMISLRKPAQHLLSGLRVGQEI